MDGLFGSWLYIVLHIVNLAVLVLLLRLIIYKPMKKFMAKRKEELDKEVASLDEAAAKSEGAVRFWSRRKRNWIKSSARIIMRLCRKPAQAPMN